MSKDYFSGTHSKPLAGQGSSTSPAVWLSRICMALLPAYSLAVPKMIRLVDPTDKVVSSRNADVFVDDTSIGFRTTLWSGQALQSPC